MKNNIIKTLTLATFAILTIGHAMAQDIPTEELSRSVSSYTAEMSRASNSNYQDNLHRFCNDYPSVRLKNSVQSNRKFNNAEIGCKMTTRLCDIVNKKLTQIVTKHGDIRRVKRTDIFIAVYFI